MTSRGQLRFWLIGLALFLIALYLLRAILLPFVAGMAVAYFLDPVCDWLERHGCSRNWATAIVSVGFAIVIVIALLLLVPLLQHQILEFAGRLPGYIDAVTNRLLADYLENRNMRAVPASGRHELARLRTIL